MRDTCQVCTAPATKRCSACKGAFYCSSEHQRADWKTHKGSCIKNEPGGGLSRGLEREVRRAWPAGCEVVLPASRGSEADNLLVLLHGLGDSATPFAGLARKMRLPRTAAVALSGPIEVPLTDGGRAWHLSFDEEYNLLPPGHPLALASLERTLHTLRSLVLDTLVGSQGWPLERIHLLGFSQGGLVALRLAMDLCHAGSAVAISSGLPAGAHDSAPGGGGAGAGPRTPVLITHGKKDEVVEPGSVDRAATALRARGHAVQLLTLQSKGHEMISGPEEMRGVMAFWADSFIGGRGGVPEGFVEVQQPEDHLLSAAQEAARRGRGGGT